MLRTKIVACLQNGHLSETEIDHLVWFLSLETPMVIYAPESLFHIIKRFRRRRELELIPLPSSTEITDLRKLELLWLHSVNSDYVFYVEWDILSGPPKHKVWPDPYKIRFFEDKLLVRASIVGGSVSAIKKNNKIATEFDHLPDTQIFTSLAIGSKLPISYPKEPRLKAITTATTNIKEEKLALYRKTAEHFGYNYAIVGRDKPWKGFKTKVSCLNEELQNTTEPYVVLTDSTDVFFTGSALELLEKFIKMDKGLVVGGERKIYYKKGRYSDEEIKKYFASIATGTHMFPNTGFIMGKTDEMKKLLAYSENCADDQAAVMDTIFSKKMKVEVDCTGNIIGNVVYNQGSEFYYNPETNRYQNESGAPPVLHFPGQNLQVMKDYFFTLNPDYFVPAPSSAVWTLVIIFAILILFIIVVFLLGKYRKTWLI